MNAQTRVLLLTPYARPHTGGVSTYVHNLAEALKSYAGAQCTIVANRGDSGDAVVGGSGSVISFLVRSLFWTLRLRPHVVHAHAHWYTLPSAILLRGLGLRFYLVFSFHTMLPEDRPVRFRFLLEFFINRCDRIAFVSRSLGGQVTHRLGIRRPVAYLYPGVGCLPSGATGPVPGPGGQPAIGFAGPLVWPGKAAGLLFLIEAVAILSRDLPHVRLRVAGSGPFEEEAKAKASTMGLDERVEFLGNLPSLDSFWPSTTVYAHISLQEGMPLSLLEAMAHGKPVVANPVGGVSEVIEDRRNGLLVQPSPPAIARALAGLLQDPERLRRLGEEARRTAETRFSLRTFADSAMALYAGGGLKSTSATGDVRPEGGVPLPIPRGSRR